MSTINAGDEHNKLRHLSAECDTAATTLQTDTGFPTIATCSMAFQCHVNADRAILARAHHGDTGLRCTWGRDSARLLARRHRRVACRHTLIVSEPALRSAYSISVLSDL